MGKTIDTGSAVEGRRQSSIIHAIDTAKEMYNLDVSVSAKRKDLIKFGENRKVQVTQTTLMELPAGVDNEILLGRNGIDTISSSDLLDKQKITIEGHTVGADLSITSLTHVGGVATAVCASHGLLDGGWTAITGAVETEYNGIVKITYVDDNTFTFSVDSGAATPATGTIISTDQRKTFIVQYATLNGQSKVVLDTPLARSTRAYVSNQDRATDLLGTISIYEDTAIVAGVPTDGTKVHLIITGVFGHNTSLKASTTISNSDFWFIAGIQAHLLEKTAAVGEVMLQKRELGGVWRDIDKLASVGNSAHLTFENLIVIPPNTDVRLVSQASGADKHVGGSIEGYLGKVV